MRLLRKWQRFELYLWMCFRGLKRREKSFLMSVCKCMDLPGLCVNQLVFIGFLLRLQSHDFSCVSRAPHYQSIRSKSESMCKHCAQIQDYLHVFFFFISLRAVLRDFRWNILFLAKTFYAYSKEGRRWNRISHLKLFSCALCTELYLYQNIHTNRYQP